MLFSLSWNTLPHTSPQEGRKTKPSVCRVLFWAHENVIYWRVPHFFRRYFRGGGTRQVCSSRQAYILQRLSPQNVRYQSNIGLGSSFPEPQSVWTFTHKQINATIPEGRGTVRAQNLWYKLQTYGMPYRATYAPHNNMEQAVCIVTW